MSQFFGMRYLLSILMALCWMGCGKGDDAPEVSHQRPNLDSQNAHPPSQPKTAIQPANSFALSQNVVSAWIKKGFFPGWVDVKTGQFFKDKPDASSTSILPALRSNRISPGVLKSLPAPRKGFALFVKGGFSREGLKELEHLKTIKWLYLMASFPNESLKNLSALDKLATLMINDGRGQITDAGLEELAKLKQLESLGLQGVNITQAGVATLAEMDNLHSLTLPGSKITDTGLKELGRLNNLKVLELSGSKITDAGLGELSGLDKLEYLGLSYALVTDSGLKELSKFKQLSRLSLPHKITDSGLVELLPISKLTELNLVAINITDAGMKELAKLIQLRKLNLAGAPKISDAGMKELAGLENLVEFRLSGSNITKAGIRELAKLNALKIIRLHPNNQRLDEKDVTELKKALPIVKIIWGP